MNWQDAFEILKPIPTDDYVGGAWHPIRYHKTKALFELAQSVTDGCIVELGTFRGLGAIALALGASVPVFTVDDFAGHTDYLGVNYAAADCAAFYVNAHHAHVAPKLCKQEVREAAREWQLPVSLLVWDLGETGRVKADVEAWLPHLAPDAKVAVKELEDGSFGGAQLLALGFEKVQSFPEGCVDVYQKTNGTAIWIVDEAHLPEASISAESVRRHMPHVKCEIFLSREREHAEWFVESTRLLCEALKELPDGEKVLWLDSDTYVCEPVNDLFEMLDRFDMCMAHAPGHKTAPTRIPVPDSFPEFNIGVIAMRNNSKIRALWKWVHDNQLQYADVYGDNDQAALRETLWNIGNGTLQIAVLPAEYNCRFQFGCQVRDRVKILHGRAESAAHYETLAKSINAGWREGYQVPPRMWSPHVPR